MPRKKHYHERNLQSNTGNAKKQILLNSTSDSIAGNRRYGDRYAPECSAWRRTCRDLELQQDRYPPDVVFAIFLVELERGATLRIPGLERTRLLGRQTPDSLPQRSAMHRDRT